MKFMFSFSDLLEGHKSPYERVVWYKSSLYKYFFVPDIISRKSRKTRCEGTGALDVQEREKIFENVTQHL